MFGGPGIFKGNAVKIRDGRAAVSVCSDCKSEIRETFYPLSGIRDWCRMGRSLEVRRKSENLPVVSFVCPVFSRFGTRCEFLVLSFRTAISFVGTAVFYFDF